MLGSLFGKGSRSGFGNTESPRYNTTTSTSNFASVRDNSGVLVSTTGNVEMVDPGALALASEAIQLVGTQSADSQGRVLDIAGQAIVAAEEAPDERLTKTTVIAVAVVAVAVAIASRY